MSIVPPLRQTALALLLGIAAGLFLSTQISLDVPPAAARPVVIERAPAPVTSNFVLLTAKATIADDAADVGDDAWRGGWLTVAAMVGLWFAGRIAVDRRGYIAKRWPKLDNGRAWSALAVVMGALVTLIPLGLADKLDAAALRNAAVFASGLLLEGNMDGVKRKSDERRGQEGGAS